VGGSSIQFHAFHPHTLDRIKLYDWDYIVLQESSGKVAFPSTAPEIVPFFLIQMLRYQCSLSQGMAFLSGLIKAPVS